MADRGIDILVVVLVLLAGMVAGCGRREFARLDLVDHRPTAPIPLAGRLVVTFVDTSIDEARGDQHEVAVVDLTGPHVAPRCLTRDLVNQAEVEASPDGTRFLYTERPKLDAFDRASEIWCMNADGTGKRCLVRGGHNGVPAWYPDGTKFLYITWGGDAGDSRLLVYSLADGTSTPFPTDLRAIADPEVSYDGRLVTFKMPVEGDRDFQPSIYVMNADGSDVRRLTRGWSDHDPVFSRDGGTIFFERYYGPGDWFEASQDRGVPVHNQWGIVAVDVASGNERVVIPHDPSGAHMFWLPTVSPCGTYLMFIHNEVWGEEDGRPWTDLWVATIDGSDLQKVPGSDWCYFLDWTN